VLRATACVPRGNHPTGSGKQKKIEKGRRSVGRGEAHPASPRAFDSDRIDERAICRTAFLSAQSDGDFNPGLVFAVPSTDHDSSPKDISWTAIKRPAFRSTSAALLIAISAACRRGP
jgi:hypothetical protein